MIPLVASLRISEDGKKEFRVLHCVSLHPRAVRSASDSKFCIGCLAPPRSRAKTTHDVYVFSRYWNVASDRSLFAHFAAVLCAPLLECLRALLIYILLARFHPSHAHIISTDRAHIARMLLLMFACDVGARRLTLWIKSGLLVSLMSLTSMILDQLATMAV